MSKKNKINNTTDLTKFLAKSIEEVSEGDLSYKALQSFASASDSIQRGIKNQLEQAKIAGVTPNIKFLK